MVDIKHLRTEPDAYKDSAKHRGIDVDIDKLLELDAKRTKLVGEIDELRAKLNVKGKPSEDELKALHKVKAELAEQETKLRAVEEPFAELLVKVPNLHSKDTPIGKDDTENKVIRQVGDRPEFSFKPKEHWELGEALGFIDTVTAAEVAGSRFAYLKGGLAELQFALVNFIIKSLTNEDVIKEIVKSADLDISTKPFSLVVPPVMIRRNVLDRMARLNPIEDRYRVVSGDEEQATEGPMDLFLTGSAEHTLGPLHMDETLPEAELPIRYLGYATAFRGEAGSYGKDVRGILRLHQFDKLEMESFSLPETSIAEQDFFVAVQEYLMQQLELPYQVVAICTGDMGDPDYRQIDIETWMPGQAKYRETNTSDLMTDFQSRRLKTRVRRADGSVELVHMNDATAGAVGRLLIAIMENYQQEDGSIQIPKALQQFYGRNVL